MKIYGRLFILIYFFILSLPALAVSTKSVSSASPASQSASNEQMLSNQLAATITAAENYQKQLKSQLLDLQQQNVALKQQLNAVQEKLTMVSAEVASRQTSPKKIVPVESAGISQWIASLNLDNPMIDMRLAIGLIVLGLLLLAWLFWYHRPKLIEETDQENDDEDEYDFMGSDEAIPAKLDLARAYIEMSKKDEAIKILEEVAIKGDAAQKQEAQQIRKQLKN